MAIKLLTLNIENDRHLARVHEALAEHQPDIACLQEVLEQDCAYLASSGGYHVKYALGGYQRGPGDSTRNWGVAVLSRVPVRRQTVSYYVEDLRMRVLREPNDPRRASIVTELNHQGRDYRIATTHFTWTADGQINAQQKTDFARLRQQLADYPDYVLCGDFNAPRGREMYGKFVDELGLIDHLPANVTSTLDPQYHRVATLELVVDLVLSTKDYRVLDTRLLSGISDHKGILAWVERET